MNLKESWELRIDQKVFRELRKFPKKDVARITGGLEDENFDPYANDIEKIKGEDNTWRRRSGAYRIFYEINQSERFVNIFWVERRTSSTY